jgi:alpha-beta hydrolase superfamily lysophospholipase
MRIFEKMNGMAKRRIKRTLISIATIYLVGGVVLYFIQEIILFHPKALSKEHGFSFEQPFEEINIPFENNNLNIVKFPTANRKGIVLFYHGNMENVEHYKKYPSIFLRNGYELWMIDYPGFGKTTGKLTEKIMNDQALLMYNLASKEINSDSIVIYGKSMGTGVASYVASCRDFKQLILETPYYSIPSLAKHYFPIYPVDLLIRYSFPIHDYLKKIQASITIFHGTKDEVVPYKHSKWLKEENKNLELITIENGRHDNLSDFDLFQRKLDSLLIK